jgi:hypothetical protein
MAKPKSDTPIKFKAGDTAFMKCVGYGLISYEGGENVVSVRKGIITLYQRDTKYDGATGQSIGGGSLGLTCSVCVTPREIENAKKYIADMAMLSRLY